MSPTQLGKQGNIKQLGGDFIFGPGTFYQNSNRDTGLICNDRQYLLICISNATHGGSWVSSLVMTGNKLM